MTESIIRSEHVSEKAVKNPDQEQKPVSIKVCDDHHPEICDLFCDGRFNECKFSKKQGDHEK